MRVRHGTQHIPVGTDSSSELRRRRRRWFELERRRTRHRRLSLV